MSAFQMFSITSANPYLPDAEYYTSKAQYTFFVICLKVVLRGLNEYRLKLEIEDVDRGLIWLVREREQHLGEGKTVGD